jgi:hypothetical protein
MRVGFYTISATFVKIRSWTTDQFFFLISPHFYYALLYNARTHKKATSDCRDIKLTHLMLLGTRLSHLRLLSPILILSDAETSEFKNRNLLPVHRERHFTPCSFLARSKNCEKRLLPSTCPPVCLSVCPHGTTRFPLGGL